MRVVGLLVLSILMTTQAALAQIGVRTAKPDPAGMDASPKEIKAAGLRGAGDVTIQTDNIQTMRMEVDPVVKGEEPGACVTGTGRFPTLASKIPKNATDKQKKEIAAFNATRTDCFWRQKGQEYLKYARFVNSSKTAGIATDVLSDTIGPFRLVLSTAIAANTDNDDDTGDGETTNIEEDQNDDEPTSGEDKALNLLAANGGNLAFTASLPLYAKPMSSGKFLWNSYARLGGNVQAFGESESALRFSDTNANLELAFSEFQLDLLSDAKEFNILAYAKTSAIVGTKKFAESIGDPSRAFLHGQLGAGIRLSNLVNIHLTYNWYSDDKIPGDGATIAFSMGK